MTSKPANPVLEKLRAIPNPNRWEKETLALFEWQDSQTWAWNLWYLWLNSNAVDLVNIARDESDQWGFVDTRTGEVMCPFRHGTCRGSKCSWWEAVVLQKLWGPGSRLDKYACWFFLGSDIMLWSERHPDPEDWPEQVIQKLRTEGWDNLPPLKP